jgi:hypothetical protein
VTRASKPPQSLPCKGGAAFPHFVAVQGSRRVAVGGGFVELVSRDLVERASCRASRSTRSTRWVLLPQCMSPKVADIVAKVEN